MDAYFINGRLDSEKKEKVNLCTGFDSGYIGTDCAADSTAVCAVWPCAVIYSETVCARCLYYCNSSVWLPVSGRGS